MHELGIMTGVVEVATSAAKDAGATKIFSITMLVGEMTEAIEDALHFSFEVLAEGDPLLEGCQLEVKMVSPKSRCLECFAEYEHDRFHMTCPKCGSPLTQLLAGRELTIESLDVDIPDEVE